MRVDNYFSEQDKTSECASLQAIPGLEQKMDLANQRFDLTIPQVALLNTARGYVSPERWDEGIAAGLLNYSVSGQQDLHHRNGVDSSNQFVSLQPGLNLGRGVCVTIPPTATLNPKVSGIRCTPTLPAILNP